MEHTLKDVAKNAKVTKVAAFQHFKRLKNKLGNHIKKQKNRIVLDDKAYYQLLNSFNHLNKNISKQSNDLMIVKILKSALKDKSNRIKELNKQNANLNQLLKHQQELQLGEQRHNKALIQSLNKSLNYSNKKHGLWWKISHIFNK